MLPAKSHIPAKPSTRNPTPILDAKEEDLSKLEPIERLVREKELLAEIEQRILSHVKALQLDPHAEVKSSIF